MVHCPDHPEVIVTFLPWPIFLSKYVLLFPVRQATAAAVTRLVEDEVFLVYSCPQYLICDNGTQFRSKEFHQLCEDYKVKIRHTPAYHPQANPVERVNRVVKTMLTAYVNDNQRKWAELLPKVACAIRTAVHETTMVTPFFTNFGREHVGSGDQYNLLVTAGAAPAANAPQRNFEQLFADVRKRLAAAHEKSKRRYNLRRRPVQYQIGEQVYRRNFTLSDASRGFTAKLAPKFVGPFKINKKISPITYELIDGHGRTGTWHVKDIKAHPPEDIVNSD